MLLRLIWTCCDLHVADIVEAGLPLADIAAAPWSAVAAHMAAGERLQLARVVAW